MTRQHPPGSALLLLLTFVLPGHAAMAQDPVDDPNATMFMALEAAVEAAFPGASVERDPPTVIHPDGTSDRVEVGCYQEGLLEGRETVVLSFGFPERIRAAVAREISVDEAVAAGRAPRLALVTLNDDGIPAAGRVAFLEPGGGPATCERVSLEDFPGLSLYSFLLEGLGKVEGPVIDVETTTLHDFRGMLASAVWGGVFDPVERRFRLLVPAAASLDSGATELFLMKDAVEPGVIELEGRTTGRTFRYECQETDACLIPVEQVLTWLSGG